MMERIVWITMDNDDSITLWSAGSSICNVSGSWITQLPGPGNCILVASVNMSFHRTMRELLALAGITDAEIMDHPVRIILTLDGRRA